MAVFKLPIYVTWACVICLICTHEDENCTYQVNQKYTCYKMLYNTSIAIVTKSVYDATIIVILVYGVTNAL